MSTTPLRPHGGDAKRLRPMLELGSGGTYPKPGTIGPWGAYVRVTPIDGLSRNAVRALVPDASSTNGLIYEVGTSWCGPGLDGLPPTLRPVQGTDTIVVGDPELAEAIANAAAELLRDRRLPWLRHVKAAIETDRAGWRRRYESEVNDGDRPDEPWLADVERQR